MRQRGRAVLTHLVCPSTRDDDDAASASSRPHPPRPMRRRLALAYSPPASSSPTTTVPPHATMTPCPGDLSPCRPHPPHVPPHSTPMASSLHATTTTALHPPRRPSTHDDDDDKRDGVSPLPRPPHATAMAPRPRPLLTNLVRLSTRNSERVFPSPTSSLHMQTPTYHPVEMETTTDPQGRDVTRRTMHQCVLSLAFYITHMLYWLTAYPDMTRNFRPGLVFFGGIHKEKVVLPLESVVLPLEKVVLPSEKVARGLNVHLAPHTY